MCSELKRRGHQLNPRNWEKLWELSHREWYLISGKMKKDLYATFLGALKQLVKPNEVTQNIKMKIMW